MEQFPKSHIVTFRYYLGVIHFLDEEYHKVSQIGIKPFPFSPLLSSQPQKKKRKQSRRNKNTQTKLTSPPQPRPKKTSPPPTTYATDPPTETKSP